MINKINKKKLKKVINSLMIIGMFVLLFSVSRPAFAVASGVDKTTQDEISGQPDIDDNTLDINISSNAGSMKLESTLQILIMLTILSLAPSILIMVTSFTRIVVVFHFLRTGLGNADYTTESGDCWTCIVYYDCNYVTGFYGGKY